MQNQTLETPLWGFPANPMPQARCVRARIWRARRMVQPALDRNDHGVKISFFEKQGRICIAKAAITVQNY
jgi:hypothetical protein